MFEQIKLPVCPVCGAECQSATSTGYGSDCLNGWDMVFSCGTKLSAYKSGNIHAVDGCRYSHSEVAKLRAELARLQANPDIRALDAARQRHAEVKADVAQRLRAAQDEQGKGYGTSV